MRLRQELTEVIDTLDQEQKEYLNVFFKNCPEEVIQAIQYVRIPEGQTILQAGMDYEYVWVVIKGAVSGEDIQMLGNVYSFFEHSGINIMGDYEPFAGLLEYQKTVYAATACEAFRIPAAIYMRWMKQDLDALFMRAQVFAQTLADEISHERKYLLLNAKDRLVLYLLKAYSKWECDGDCIIRKTQAQLAQRIGMNVRTIQRSILRLEKENMVSCQSGKIHISAKQYEKLKEYRNANLIN